jgi:sporulation protein YhbH
VSLKIERDHSRFRDIVRGRIRKGLRDYISHGEMIGKQGKDTVSIPIPQIDVPRFTFGQKGQGGVGQGQGKPGEPVGPGEEGDGAGEAGEGEGDHILEVDVSLDELADILGEELELPNIEDKGKRRLESARNKYTGVRRIGPESLRHFKRTYKEALRRTIATGTYTPDSPIIVPQHHDKRFRSWREDEQPAANAVIIYMMDVSGSMGDEQKEIVRLASFWIDTWLRKQYDGIESRYIIHDAAAREVDRETFFHTRESGGTMISSAYQLAWDLIEREYPVSEWNIYPFHFSDGDNWSTDDTGLCMKLLKDKLIPASNMFAYGQVHSPYGSGQFIKDLREALAMEEKLVLSEINDRDSIVGSLKDFLGNGR